MEILIACVTTTLGFVWDSLYGLIFGFLISAIAQITFSRGAMERAIGPGFAGVVRGMGFGIIASACSYGAAAAARGFYAKGADARSVFAFMISSTNMNVAILIMFWAMLGWRFAFAEFFGGIIIVTIVAGGLTLWNGPELRAGADAAFATDAPAPECLQCGMDGEDDHAVFYAGRTYRFCGARHEAAFRADPAGVLAQARADDERMPGLRALRDTQTWKRVLDTMLADVEMLRSELLVGFIVAGLAAALIPPSWITRALAAIGHVPVAGYPLVLLSGLVIAVLTFVCSMGNVPIARYLSLAGIPLGANTTFIYGDLLIPPLVAIYRKSFPPRLVYWFLGLFTGGALVAGAAMDLVFTHGAPAEMTMPALTFSDRFTAIANAFALLALALVVVLSRQRRDLGLGQPTQ